MLRLKIFFCFLFLFFLSSCCVDNSCYTISAIHNNENKKNNNDFLNNNYYYVLYVIDGDTFNVAQDNNNYRIRVIGMNSPEIYPDSKKECFGKEAKNKAIKLLEHKMVYLERDDTQDNQDKYGRYLRIVKLNKQKIDFANEMIKSGFAREYTFKNRQYRNSFQYKESENYAKKNKLGIWSEKCFNYK